MIFSGKKVHWSKTLEKQGEDRVNRPPVPQGFSCRVFLETKKKAFWG
jgi:hypothetical protein